jgi:hypothetical protein
MCTRYLGATLKAFFELIGLLMGGLLWALLAAAQVAFPFAVLYIALRLGGCV